MDQNNSLEPEDNGLDMAQDDPSSLETIQPTSPTSSLENVENTGKIIDKVEEVKKPPFLKRIVRGTNIYLLLFVLLLVIAAVIATVVYISSRNATNNTVPTQTLTQDALKQLATSDVTVGQPKQTLSVQSNAVFAGNVLVRDSLQVAGTIQVGGSLNVPGITVSGNSVFEQLQVNKSLGVAGDTAMQGQATISKNLTVGGSGTFGGAISAPQINVNALQLNGNLTLTKHIAAGGATPGRSNGDALGGGGTTAVSGSDIAGTVNVNTGNGANAGCFLTVTFTSRYNSTPRVNVTPIGAAAGSLAYYVNRTTSNFSICTASTPPSNASFTFDYFIVE